MKPVDSMPAQPVQIRPAHAADALALTIFYAGLGRRTLHGRFRSGAGSLSPAHIRRVTTAVDAAHGDRRSLIATVDDCGTERIVAHAEWWRDGIDTAQCALIVADYWQGRGIGRRLLQALADDARRSGIRGLHADVPLDNVPMQRLLRGLGARQAEHPTDAGLAAAWIPLAGGTPLPAIAWVEAWIAALAGARRPLTRGPAAR